MTLVFLGFGDGVAVAADADEVNIVLLGDSYSAGNGAGDYYGARDCYRSTSNWAERYRSWLDTQGYDVSLVNRACSGSVTDDVLEIREMDRRHREQVLDGRWEPGPALETKLRRTFCDPFVSLMSEWWWR